MLVSFFSFISLERKNYYRNRVLIHPYKYRRIEFPRISFKSPRFYLLVCGWIMRGDKCFETMNENEWFLGRNAAMLITSRYVISVSVKAFHVSWGRHVSKAVNATARTCVRNVIKIWNCLSAEGERERKREINASTVSAPLRFVTRLLPTSNHYNSSSSDREIAGNLFIYSSLVARYEVSVRRKNRNIVRKVIFSRFGILKTSLLQTLLNTLSPNIILIFSVTKKEIYTKIFVILAQNRTNFSRK